MKLKENKNSFEERFIWVVPVLEVLVYLPLLLAIYLYPLMILYYDNLYISAFGKILLETAIIEKSIVLFFASLVAFGAKIVSAFFILKKSKWGYFSIIALYLMDFIVSLISLCLCETTLQEMALINSVGVFSSVFITSITVCLFVNMYFRIIKHRKKTKEFKIFTAICFSVLIVVLSFVWIDGNKKTASESEVATLNRCYEYSEKYLYEKLPEDKETLEKMQSDIEEVFSKELFFTAFNQSEYFDRLKEEGVSIADIPIKIKSEYANELMYLKCKILLKLDKNEEYIAYYAETRRYFSSTTFYNKHLQRDKEVFSEEDYEVIKNGCIKFLESDAVEYEKVLCIADYGFVNSKYFTDEERKTIGREMREKYIPGYEITSGRLYEDLKEWEVVERSLYMMK